MCKRQTVFLSLIIVAHFLLAAFCPILDAPPPGDYRDFYPLATVLFLAPFLAGGISLIACALSRFWSGHRRGQMPLILLVAFPLCFTLVHSGFSQPLFWLYMLPWVVVLYLLSWAVLALCRWIYDKLS